MPVLQALWLILPAFLTCLCEASFFGMLLQLGLELFAVAANPREPGPFDIMFSPRLGLCCLLLPILVSLVAAGGTIMTELVHDSMQHPPWCNARATYMVFLSCMRGKDVQGTIDKSSPGKVDFFLTWFCLISTVVGALINCLWHRSTSREVWWDVILHGLAAGAFFWTVLMVCAFATAQFYNNVVWPRKSQTEPAMGKRCTILSDAITMKRIMPGETWNGDTWKDMADLQNVLAKQHLPDDEASTTEEVEIDVEASTRKKTPERQGTTWGLKVALLLIVWFGTVSLCIIAGQILQSIRVLLVIAVVGISFTLLSFLWVIDEFLPRFARNKFFRTHYVVFVFLVVLVTCLGLSEEDSPKRLKPLMTFTDATELGDVFTNTGTDRSLGGSYPVCGNSWGSPDSEVRILDLSAMSQYAYANDEKNFDDLLSQTFRSATSVHFDEYNVSDLPRIVASRHCGNESESCTLILAVRGTTTTLEKMVDLAMFGTVSILQIADRIFSVCGTLPVTLLRTLLSWSRSPFMRRKQESFFKKMEKVVGQLQARFPKDAMVITGHSLGAFFAEVAGAKLNVKAVGFSAPGQFYLSETLRTTRQSLLQNSLTIIPSSDVVPHVADHIDMVQRIHCLDSSGHPRNSKECHRLDLATCELWRVCGDKEGRNFAKTCLKSKFVNRDCIGRFFDSSKDAKCKGTE